MVTVAEQRSLYEDWRLRREQLASTPFVAEQYRQMQIQLLDYLLRRYRDAQEAQSPARFPLRSDVIFNERAIVIHHHLWPGKVSSTKNIFDVKQRISGIVDRMQRALVEQKGLDDEDGAESLSGESELTSAGQPASVLPPAMQTARTLRGLLRSFCWRMQVTLSSDLEHRRRLRRCFRDVSKPEFCDAWSLDCLLHDKHPDVRRHAFRAWLDRVKSGCRDEITRQLTSVFARLNEKELDRVRFLLASDNRDVRIQAVEVIGRFGTLDDVALLSDLLSLPPQQGEHLDERAAMGMAIQQLVGRDPSI